jgi:hypothetical protein
MSTAIEWARNADGTKGETWNPTTNTSTITARRQCRGAARTAPGVAETPGGPDMAEGTSFPDSGASWAPVPGYAGYFVTADGAIRGPRGIMRPMVMPSGHYYILAYRPSVPRKLFVHTAVLLAWSGPRPKGMQCRHLDGDPSHNELSNLRWGSVQQNSDDKQRHGTQSRGERSGGAKLSEADVREIRRLYGSLTLRALAERFGVSHTAIRRAATGYYWGHVA